MAACARVAGSGSATEPTGDLECWGIELAKYLRALESTIECVPASSGGKLEE